jgi:ATP-dependent exoDNAse (exonuclease V) beta subunit
MATEENIRFLLYRSSAGSGKTYTLVKEYIKIALKNQNNFKDILGITFTNKAAGEMKERIISYLRNLSLGKDVKLETEIRQELPHVDSIRQSSRNFLATILHNYSDFAIMTIDSFIHGVVRAFALEMELPLNFNVEINNDRIETHIIERLLSQVGRDEYITKIILEYIFSKIYEDKSWSIEAQIKRIDREILGEKNLTQLQKLKNISNAEFCTLIHQLRTLRNDYLSSLNHLGKEALDLISQSNLTLTDFPYKTQGAAGFFKKCALLSSGDLKDFEINKRFLREEWISKSMPQEIKEKIIGLLNNGLKTIIHKILNLYNKKNSMALTAVVLLDNIFLTALTNHMYQLVDEYKQKNNMIPISELNKIVYNIVKTSPVPFIYAIIGEKYNHYLIDEFQDTSRLQWDNLLPLIENSLSSGFFNIAVGDGKQSIYRWRGGDVEIMEKDLNIKFSQQLSIQSLQRNYRSRSKIVEFNSLFFKMIADSYISENELLENIYRDIEQESDLKEGGFVSICFFDEPGQETVPLIDYCIQIIEDCLKRDYTYGDIVFLVRQKIEGENLAKELLRNNIPVISPDALNLSKIPVIQFLMDILRYLTNPENKILESSIIFYLSLNIKEPVDPNLASDHILSNIQWDLLPEISEFFTRKKYLRRLPVYELIEELIRVFRLNQVLSFRSSGFLQSFLDTIAEFTRDNNADLISFLDWWEFNKNEFNLLVPENKNAIRIMTIHKAKGLEFPTVIIPYADWNYYQRDSQLWLIPDPPLPIEFPFSIPLPVINKKPIEDSYYKKELQTEKSKVLIDNINLLYVAFTRAMDNLYILSGFKKKRQENYYFLKEYAIPQMKEDIHLGSIYTWGKPAIKKKMKMPHLQDIHHYSVNELPSFRWFSKISIRRRSSEFWKFDATYRTKRRNWGMLVHQILSQIKSTDDLYQVIEEELLAGNIESAEKNDLKKEVGYILEMKQVKEWFHPGVTTFTESRIITPEGILRPDRVIISGDQVTIIDFKTGNPQKVHNQQMKRYAAVIRTMGYSKIEAFLLYLEQRSIIKVKVTH